MQRHQETACLSVSDLCATGDSTDIETPLRFHRRPIGPSATLPGTIPVVAPIDNYNPDGVWYNAGSEVMQFAINKVSNAKRGKSDLATLLPWLRRYKDWLTDRVRINKYKGAFLWDVQLTGADRKAIERKRAEYSYPPEPGSVIIHNESEKWSAVKPEISANDAANDGRAIKLMVAVAPGGVVNAHNVGTHGSPTQLRGRDKSAPTLVSSLYESCRRRF